MSRSATTRRLNSQGSALLVAEGVGLSYGSTLALTNANVIVGAGEVVALVGSSGSGKTSLLYCLAGLVQPTIGAVRFAGEDLARMDDEERARLRREQFGFVFQFAELVPELTLRENLLLPMEFNRVSRPERHARCTWLLKEFGLVDQADRRPAQVSGGQAQRAAVARALAHRPSVVFADEPTGSLDHATGTTVLTSLLSAARVDGVAVILVTHDPEVAGRADRVGVMCDGRTGEGDRYRQRGTGLGVGARTAVAR